MKAGSCEDEGGGGGGGRKEGRGKRRHAFLSFFQSVRCGVVQCSATELIPPAAHTLEVSRKRGVF